MKTRFLALVFLLALFSILIVSCETTPPASTPPETSGLPASDANPALPPQEPETESGDQTASEPPAAEEASPTLDATPLVPIPDLPGLSLRLEPPASGDDFALDEGRPPRLADRLRNPPEEKPLVREDPETLPPSIGDRALAQETPAQSEQDQSAPLDQIGTESDPRRGNPPEKEAAALTQTEKGDDPAPLPDRPSPQSDARSEPLLRDTPLVPELPPTQIPPLAITPPLLPEKEPEFSRTVQALVGQLVEIPFYGAGWVYLGERFSRPGLDYRGRRLDDDGQSFTFVGREEGTFEISFFRHDFVEDRSTPDYVRLVIARAPDGAYMGRYPEGAESRVIAERWPEPEKLLGKAKSDVEALADTQATTTSLTSGDPRPAGPEKAPGRAEGSADADTPRAIGTDSSIKKPSFAGMTREALLEEARKAIDGKRGVAANELLEQYLALEPQGSPAAYLLFARIHELEGASRDIKRARYWYARIIEDFPLSVESLEADTRIKYLDRFYFGIR